MSQLDVGGPNVDLVALLDIHIADCVKEPGANAQTLEVWKDDKARDALAVVRGASWLGKDGAESNNGLAPLQEPALGRRRKGSIQIVMRSENFPDLSLLLPRNSLEGEVDAFFNNRSLVSLSRRSYTLPFCRSMRMSGLT